MIHSAFYEVWNEYIDYLDVKRKDIYLWLISFLLLLFRDQ